MTIYYTKGNSKEERYKLFKLEQDLKKKFKQEKKDKREKRKKVINGVYNKLKKKKITYRKSNPLKSLLKTHGRVPNVQVKQGENVNLWK